VVYEVHNFELRGEGGCDISAEETIEWSELTVVGCCVDGRKRERESYTVDGCQRVHIRFPHSLPGLMSP
jgi:hypothetical protein